MARCAATANSPDQQATYAARAAARMAACTSEARCPASIRRPPSAGDEAVQLRAFWHATVLFSGFPLRLSSGNEPPGPQLH